MLFDLFVYATYSYCSGCYSACLCISASLALPKPTFPWFMGIVLLTYTYVHCVVFHLCCHMFTFLVVAFDYRGFA